jgi:hypothetical protein
MAVLVSIVSLVIHFTAAAAVIYLLYTGIETGEYEQRMISALFLATVLIGLDTVLGLFLITEAVPATVTAGIGYLTGTISAVSVLRPESTAAQRIPNSHG